MANVLLNDQLSEMKNGRPDWTIVIPLLDEALSVEPLCQRIDKVIRESKKTVQVIFIDDGSTDDSWIRIRDLADRYRYIEAIRFRRNFGKAAALSAGFSRARAPLVLTMDADLQDDPDEIPRLVAELESGVDCVSGWKMRRQDPWDKRWPSKVFNFCANRVSGLHLRDHNCGLKAYRRSALDEIQLYGELHRFIPALLAARGFKISEIGVNHLPRLQGQSKYGWKRIPKGFLDLITVSILTGYRTRPSHLIGSLGLISFVFGFVLLTLLSLMWIFSRLSTHIPDVHLHERAIFYYAIAALVVGVQLVVAGILAELIVATQRNETASYAIAECIVQTHTSSHNSSQRNGEAHELREALAKPILQNDAPSTLQNRTTGS